MEFNESRTETIPVQLEDGSTVRIEVSKTGREDIAIDLRPFKEVTNALEGIINAIAVPISKVNPRKATVKFGVEIALESGQLTAVLVKGTSKANLEITLEWGS